MLDPSSSRSAKSNVQLMMGSTASKPYAWTAFQPSMSYSCRTGHCRMNRMTVFNRHRSYWTQSFLKSRANEEARLVSQAAGRSGSELVFFDRAGTQVPALPVYKADRPPVRPVKRERIVCAMKRRSCTEVV
jgi:hypothetical protein